MSGHFHLLTYSGGRLGGDARRMTAADVDAALAGTPYQGGPQLRAVIDGQVKGRGYKTVPAGWVAVVWRTGQDEPACIEELTMVAVAGGIRWANQDGHR